MGKERAPEASEIQPKEKKSAQVTVCGISLRKDGLRCPILETVIMSLLHKSYPSWTSSDPSVKSQLLITPLLEIYRSACYT